MLLLAITFAAGCLAHQAVPNADWPEIESGEELRVTMRSGETYEFDLIATHDQALLGEGIELSYADIAVIERTEDDLSEPAKLGLLLLATVLVFRMAAWWA